MKEKLCVLNRNRELHYFDYAATTFMYTGAMEKYKEFHNEIGVLFGKGNNKLSDRSRGVFEDAVKNISEHFRFNSSYDMIIGKNTTELINIVALSLEHIIKPMDIIMAGPYEHHSNYLPWKYLAKRSGAIFLEIPLDSMDRMNLDYLKTISSRVKLLAYSSVANSNGYVVEAGELLGALDRETLIFVDESQKTAHGQIVTDERIGGHILSSHKMYGPKNISGAFIRKDILERMEPVILGGGMINTQGFTDTWLNGSNKFFSGTYDVGLIAAWAEACRFVRSVGYEKIDSHEAYCYERIKKIIGSICGVKVIGSEQNAKSMLTFTSSRCHPHDIEAYLASRDIIIRSGNLCSQNSIRKLEQTAVNRISFGLAVDENDLYALERTLQEYLSTRGE